MTNDLLLCLTKLFCTTRKVVAIDRGFYIINLIIELIKVVVCVASVIKNHQYWPRHYPGQVINNCTNTKDNRDVASLSGRIYGYDYGFLWEKQTKL